MAPTLLYLLQANAVLVLFAAAYYGLLRRLTFFSLNRAYLLGALVFAAVYPALPVPALLPASVALLPAPVAQMAGRVAAGAAAPTPGFDWQAAVLWLYAAGAGLLLLRLLGQLLSLALVRARARPTWVLGQPVRVLAGAGGPFSFGRTIYLSESSLADTAALPPALRHEQAHVRQWHTLDVLLTQLATALAWANPAAWLLRRAVLDNLEYLADQAALRTGLDRRAYQYSLLRQQPGGVPAPALAFHFSFLTLKNRIAMLNQPLSSPRQLGRYFLAAPLVVLLALGYAGARAQTAPAAKSGMHLPAGSVVYVDGVASTSAAAEVLDPAKIESMQNLGGMQARIFTHGQGNVVAITTAENKNSPKVKALDAEIAQTNALTPTIEANQLPASAQTYISRTYADCRIVEANKITPAAKQKAAYQAFIAKGRRPQGYLLFDSAGNFLERI